MAQYLLYIYYMNQNLRTLCCGLAIHVVFVCGILDFSCVWW